MMPESLETLSKSVVRYLDEIETYKAAHISALSQEIAAASSLADLEKHLLKLRPQFKSNGPFHTGPELEPEWTAVAREIVRRAIFLKHYIPCSGCGVRTCFDTLSDTVCQSCKQKQFKKRRR